MSQNPFSNPYDLPEAVVPERTSILAVLSLILGIVCVPFLGIVAVFFGVMALFGIKASRGRVSGTGLAVTGIILGIVFSLIWGACFGGALFLGRVILKDVSPAAGTIITAAQAGDVDGVRNGLGTNAQARVTPEGIESFRAALNAEMGAYKGTATTLSELGDRYGDVFQALGQSTSTSGGNPMQNHNNAIPVPLEFEKGWALVIIPFTQGSGNPSDAIENVIVVTPSGAEIVLVPYGTTLPTPAPAPTPDPAIPAPTPDPDSNDDSDSAEGEGGGG